MENNRKFIFIGFTLFGIVLLILAVFVFPAKSPTTIFGWSIGLGLCSFLLGIGNLIGSKEDKGEISTKVSPKNYLCSPDNTNTIPIRERAGYMVCKIMNLVLCAYVLILSAIHVPFFLLLMAIAILIIQFILDIVLQTHYSKK